MFHSSGRRQSKPGRQPRYNEAVNGTAGYEEIEHTADWALRVWAPDLPGLLREAAAGMYALMGARGGEAIEAPVRIAVSGMDAESLLVAYLSELLRVGENQGLMAAHASPRVDGFKIDSEIQVDRMLGLDKEIKAVTFHNLSVRAIPGGLETTIVFDV